MFKLNEEIKLSVFFGWILGALTVGIVDKILMDEKSADTKVYETEKECVSFEKNICVATKVIGWSKAD